MSWQEVSLRKQTIYREATVNILDLPDFGLCTICLLRSPAAVYRSSRVFLIHEGVTFHREQVKI
jgi:hypothetical protein